MEGSGVFKGHAHLVDARKDTDGALRFQSCGASADPTERPNNEVLEYLRQRARGKTKTIATVKVTDRGRAVPEARVSLIRELREIVAKTDSAGEARFEDLNPAKYKIATALEHYLVEVGILTDLEVQVIQGENTYGSR